MSTDALGDEEDAARNKIPIGVTPDSDLQIDTTIKGNKIGKRSDTNIFLQCFNGHGYIASLSTCFACCHSCST